MAEACAPRSSVVSPRTNVPPSSGSFFSVRTPPHSCLPLTASTRRSFIKTGRPRAFSILSMPRSSRRALFSYFRLAASSVFLPSSFPIDGPPSNAVPRAAISPSLYPLRRSPSLRSTLWLVLASVARRPDSANQPRLSVGVEGKCQGEGVDSAIGSDTNRYRTIEIASLFLDRIYVSYAAYRFASFSPFARFVARKIQLLDIRTRRSRFNLPQIWQVESLRSLFRGGHPLRRSSSSRRFAEARPSIRVHRRRTRWSKRGRKFYRASKGRGETEGARGFSLTRNRKPRAVAAPVNRNSIRSNGLLTGSFKESSRCRVIPADRPTLRAERQERGRHDFRREARSRLIRWKTKWVEWLRREL